MMEFFKRRQLLLFALFLIWTVSDARDSDNSMECYSCQYNVGKQDTENCITPGTQTPTRRFCPMCKLEVVRVYDEEYIRRTCESESKKERTVWKSTYANSSNTVQESFCRSALCNNETFVQKSRPSGKQLKCYEYKGKASDNAESVTDLCPDAVCLPTATCDGYCETKRMRLQKGAIIRNTAKLTCSHVCTPYQSDNETVSCCDSDFCNSNLNITKEFKRSPITCYNCATAALYGCEVTCPSGLCNVELHVEPNSAYTITRGCVGRQHTVWTSTSSETISVDVSWDKSESKHLIKVCETDLCNSDVDIRHSYESLLQTILESEDTTAASASTRVDWYSFGAIQVVFLWIHSIKLL